MNLYAYVGNDPLNFTDPNGLFRDRAVAAVNLFRTENVVSLEGSAGAQIGIHGRSGAVAFGAEPNLGSYERSTAFEGRRVTQSFGANVTFDPLETIAYIHLNVVATADGKIDDFDVTQRHEIIRWHSAEVVADEAEIAADQSGAVDAAVDNAIGQIEVQAVVARPPSMTSWPPPLRTSSPRPPVRRSSALVPLSVSSPPPPIAAAPPLKSRPKNP